MKKKVILGILVLLLVGSGTVGYYLLSRSNEKPVEESVVDEAIEEVDVVEEVIEESVLDTETVDKVEEKPTPSKETTTSSNKSSTNSNSTSSSNSGNNNNSNSTASSGTKNESKSNSPSKMDMTPLLAWQINDFSIEEYGTMEKAFNACTKKGTEYKENYSYFCAELANAGGNSVGYMLILSEKNTGADYNWR